MIFGITNVRRSRTVRIEYGGLYVFMGNSILGSILVEILMFGGALRADIRRMSLGIRQPSFRVIMRICGV